MAETLETAREIQPARTGTQTEAQGQSPSRQTLPPELRINPHELLKPEFGHQQLTAPKPQPPPDAPMKVRIVRSDQPGCEPQCVEWISAMGRIDDTTPGEFRKVLARLGNRKLPVLIDSAGGSVDAGISAARMIRAKGLDVVVTKTSITRCTLSEPECKKLAARGVEFGKPEARISKCASSCAFILAGGVRRYVGPWTLVGLHEIKSIQTLRRFQRHYLVQRQYQFGVPVEVKRTLVKEQTLWTQTTEGPAEEKTYERIRKFFGEMGVADSIMPILRSAPHTSIRWLRQADLKVTAMATDFVNGEQLLFPAPVAAVPPAAPVATAPALAPAVPALTAPILAAPVLAAPLRSAPVLSAPALMAPAGPVAPPAMAAIPGAAEGPSPSCSHVPGQGVPCTTGSIGGYSPVLAAPALVQPAAPPATAVPKQDPAPAAAASAPAPATVKVAAPIGPLVVQPAEASPAATAAATPPAVVPAKPKPAPKVKAKAERPARQAEPDTSWRPF